MMRSLPELLKLVWHSEHSVQINVWERNRIKLDTKLKVYRAVVLPTLLYACETWTVYQRHAKRLNHFHCLRKLLKLSGKTRLRDVLRKNQFLPGTIRPRREGSRKKKNWDDSLKIKFRGRFTHFCIIIYIYDKRFACKCGKRFIHIC